MNHAREFWRKGEGDRDVNPRAGDGRYEAGYESLLGIMIRQAMDDVRRLQAAGLIVDGQAVFPWPEGVVVTDYHYPVEVEQLLHFFKAGWAQKVLNALPTSRTARGICKELGI